MSRRIAWLALTATLLLAPPARALPDLTGCIEAEVSSGVVTFHVTVENQGDEDSGLFYWDVWFNLDHPPQDDLTQWSVEEPNVPAGESVTRSKTWTPPTYGTLNAWLSIDSAIMQAFDMVDEADEDNNLCGPVAYVIGDVTRPNLRLEAPLVEVNQNIVTHSVTVVNDGGGDAEGFAVDLFYHRESPPTPGEWGDDFHALVEGAVLGADDSLKITYPTIPFEDGVYCSYFIVDTAAQVDESDEGDNVSEPACFEVAAEVDLNHPDLMLLNVTYDDLDDPPDAVMFIASAYNGGTRAAEDFELGLFFAGSGAPQVGQLPDATIDIARLEANESKEVYLFWSGLENGTFTSWLTIDVFDVVEEMNEKNNDAGPVTVIVDKQGCDLTLPDFIWTWDSDLSIGYDVTVANVGNAPCEAFDLDVFFSLDEEPRQNDPALEAAPSEVLRHEQGLGVGEEVVLHVTWDEPEVGTHRSWAAVDLFPETSDMLHGNNVAGPLELTVSDDIYQLADVAVEEFAVARSGLSLDFHCRVANRGPRDTGPFRVAIFLDSEKAPAPGHVGDLELRVDNLGPFDPEGSGDEALWTPVVSATEDREYRIWVLADADEQVPETNELNNVDGPLPASISVTQCPFDDLLSEPCVCDGEVAQPGEFCCRNGRISTVVCETEVVIPDGAELVAEPDAGGGGGGGGCCAVDGAPHTSRAGLLLLLLVLAALTQRKLAL